MYETIKLFLWLSWRLRLTYEASSSSTRTWLTWSKFIYRLQKCPELTLGLFCTAAPDSNIPAETLLTSRKVETSREDGAVGVLLAHIVATMSNDEVVTDEAMDYPRGGDSPYQTASKVGHQEDGRTICLHSLGVLPRYQGLGLGRTIMTAYMQQMNGAGIADRIALIAHDVCVYLTLYTPLGTNT
jgi:GNAT superfamily N-acetyltransferase